MTQEDIAMISRMMAELDRKLDKILERLKNQNLF